MKLYNHLQPKEARFIITQANQGLSIYKISKESKINKDKIRRCLLACKIETREQNLQKPWKGPRIKIKYDFKKWLVTRDFKKAKRAYEYAKHSEPIYQEFISFCQNLYEKRILGKKIKRSADEFIKEFKKRNPNDPWPSRWWIYKMAKNHNYSFNHQWLPHTKNKKFAFKSEHEQLKGMKYNSIDIRPDKKKLRKEKDNFEIDSFIGKRNDKQALLTMIDISTGDFYCRFYDRKMYGFANALKEIINENHLKIKTLTMDNGGENNMLWTVVDKSKLFNCHAYSSGEKGTLENKHRILRRVFPKSQSLNQYNNNDLKITTQFVNNYYSKTFNRI